jgi:hypothetical protein
MEFLSHKAHIDTVPVIQRQFLSRSGRNTLLGYDVFLMVGGKQQGVCRCSLCAGTLTLCSGQSEGEAFFILCYAI